MFTLEEIKEIEKIEKAITYLDANNGYIELDADIDIVRKKGHIEKKHKVIVDRLKIGRRKCVSKNWVDKFVLNK